MKTTTFSILLFALFACNRGSIPSSTPYVNTEIKNQDGNTILAGHCSKSILQTGSYKEWYRKNYDNYSTDTANIEAIKPLIQNVVIEIFLGSWCGDSKREVPKMLKALEQAGIDSTHIKLLFVDNSTATYKQSPQHEERGKNIHRVPTLIVYKGKKELNRLVESPVVSIEKDLLNILSVNTYKPNYAAAQYWINKVSHKNKQKSTEELTSLAKVLQPLCKHLGELNGLGYVLLAQKKYQQALEVFTINTVIYPDKYSVWDSLGEAYFTMGNNEKAKACYQKVLELKPGDSNAIQMLEKLKIN